MKFLTHAIVASLAVMSLTSANASAFETNPFDHDHQANVKCGYSNDGTRQRYNHCANNNVRIEIDWKKKDNTTQCVGPGVTQLSVFFPGQVEWAKNAWYVGLC